MKFDSQIDSDRVARNRYRLTLIITSGLLILALPNWINGQQIIRVDVNLKQLIVTVTDSEGVPVSDLDVQEFVVEIDGVPQNIAHFAAGSLDVPVSLGLLFDRSRSMVQDYKWPPAIEATDHFIRNMRDDDEFFLMTFDRNTHMRQEFTQSKDAMERALLRVEAGGPGTDVLKSIPRALDKAREGIHPKRIVLVVTDGLSGISGGCTSDEEFRTEIRESGVLAYGILVHQGPLDVLEAEIAARHEDDGQDDRASPGVFRTVGPTAAELTRPGESRNRVPRLRRRQPICPDWPFILPSAIMTAMTSESGGNWYGLDSNLSIEAWAMRLEEIFEEITTELRSQYSIGFYASDSRLYESGRLRVRTTNPVHQVRMSRLTDLDQ